MFETRISGSDGTHLVFNDKDMYDQYNEEVMLLELKYYVFIRNKYGINASNKDRFVAHVNELSDWDSKEMERRLSKHKNKLDTFILDRGFL